jgi:predicted PurR-regulated permease PerM
MNFLKWFLGIAAVMAVLSFTQSFLAPILVAFFVWYLLNAIAEYYRKLIPGQKQNTWTVIISTVLSIATFGGLIYIFSRNIKPVLKQFQEQLPVIDAKVDALLMYLSNTFGINFDASWVPDMQNIALSVGSNIASILASTGMILVYVLFFFVEQGTFHNKFRRLFETENKFQSAAKLVHKIDSGIKRYLFMKTVLSLAAAICSYIVMQAMGLELALFWAFLIFVLNYIPTFGSIVACALPIIYSFATLPFIATMWVAIALIGFQILFANLIEPKLMGKTLNLSTLAILINLVLWGTIWGATGMFFSVPLLVAASIIVSNLPQTKRIAILLSANGEISDDAPQVLQLPVPTRKPLKKIKAKKK